MTYETLPSQIDYRLLYKVKAQEAEQYLDSIFHLEKNKALLEAAKQIEQYHGDTVCIDVNGNEFTAAEMNDMF